MSPLDAGEDQSETQAVEESSAMLVNEFYLDTVKSMAFYLFLHVQMLCAASNYTLDPAGTLRLLARTEGRREEYEKKWLHVVDNMDKDRRTQYIFQSSLEWLRGKDATGVLQQLDPMAIPWRRPEIQVPTKSHYRQQVLWKRRPHDVVSARPVGSDAA
jgi:hypothetical protein